LTYGHHPLRPPFCQLLLSIVIQQENKNKLCYTTLLLHFPLHAIVLCFSLFLSLYYNFIDTVNPVITQKQSGKAAIKKLPSSLWTQLFSAKDRHG